ncbi:MAG TPA: alpha-amylase family protein [Longimicrobiales bacterium]
MKSGKRLRTAVLAALLLACSGDSLDPPPVGGIPQGRPTLAQTYRASGHAAAGDVAVHLFEWKWADIARECESVLGPAGFHAVQISPPQEHSLEPPNYPWSQRYQPVSYSIERSRSGTRAEFIDMVNRCRTAGVGIYVDAVINHMTNYPSPGVGSNGTAYSKYNYPGLYTQADFHPPCALNNYQSAANVQDCELFSLPDLKTESPTVRARIAEYLITLARLGVAGFRIDAAKHIQQVDLDEIVETVNQTLSGEGRALPYFFLEISAGAGEALGPRDYFGVGYGSGGASDITEFKFVGVGDKFRNLGTQRIWQLNPNGSPGNQFSDVAWGLLPTDKAVVFLQNHDTQHQGGISYRDGPVFLLANVWMLAQPYGYPSILSSYAFDYPVGNAMGPPSDAGGVTRSVTCATALETATIGQWVCEHRDPHILRMVAFRRHVAGTAITHWWDNGANAIAFARGDRGFVAINLETTALQTTVPTGLPAGTYVDLLQGVNIVVAADGNTQLNLPPRTAIAITTP